MHSFAPSGLFPLRNLLPSVSIHEYVAFTLWGLLLQYQHFSHGQSPLPHGPHLDRGHHHQHLSPSIPNFGEQLYEALEEAEVEISARDKNIKELESEVVSMRVEVFGLQ